MAACGTAATPVPAAPYTPRTRELTITTVPLLVKEARKLYPFLDPAFAKGGALDGKEVYAFSPSTQVVAEGDTVHFTLINPEDDVHSFVMQGLVVSLPGNSTQHATYIASHAGIYPFTCAVASHLPMMTGQLVVLAPGAIAGAAPQP
jgi:plastocyanin